jgi:tRNA A64-2'-O-ribosylphosphate transferase
MSTVSSPESYTLPTSVSSLIFSYQPTLNQTLSQLKRSRLGIRNRLTSIVEDADFVAHVAAANHLPLIANERCGSWYVPPDVKAGSVYFKSTDGHQGQWAFSLRRLNLGFLSVVERYGGLVVLFRFLSFLLNTGMHA